MCALMCVVENTRGTLGLESGWYQGTQGYATGQGELCTDRVTLGKCLHFLIQKLGKIRIPGGLAG